MEGRKEVRQKIESFGGHVFRNCMAEEYETKYERMNRKVIYDDCKKACLYWVFME